MPFKNIEKRKAYEQARYQANKEREKARTNEWFRANKVKVAIRERKRLCKKYGITQEQYEQILAEQGGVCAICRKPPSDKSLAIDHKHIEGFDLLPPKEKAKLIRGLLHSNCNVLLGLVGDNPEQLEAAAAYLRKTLRGHCN